MPCVPLSRLCTTCPLAGCPSPSSLALIEQCPSSSHPSSPNYSECTLLSARWVASAAREHTHTHTLLDAEPLSAIIHMTRAPQPIETKQYIGQQDNQDVLTTVRDQAQVNSVSAQQQQVASCDVLTSRFCVCVCRQPGCSVRYWMA